MEEISLKELIQILLKDKLVIFAVTAAFIVLGLIFSFVTPKNYTSTLMLLINPLKSTSTSEVSNLSTLLDAMNSSVLQADIETYRQLLKNSEVLSGTIERVDLKSSDGVPLNPEALAGMYEVEAITGTNLLKIDVKNRDPQLAADIANALGDVFIEIVSEMNREAAESISKSIEKNLEEEAARLDYEAQKLRDYLTNSVNMDALNGEVGVVINQINNYKASLLNTQKDIVVTRNTLGSIMNGFDPSADVSGVEMNINVINGLPEIKLNTGNDKTLQSALLTVEVTNLQTQLIKLTETEAILQEKIVDLEATLTELQSLLADEKYKYNSIQRDYSLAEQTYSAYQSKYKEAIIATASDVGSATVQISSAAAVPNNASGTSRTIIVAVAAMLGLMIAIFAVFFKEYWTSSDDYSERVAMAE